MRGGLELGGTFDWRIRRGEYYEIIDPRGSWALVSFQHPNQVLSDKETIYK